MQRAVACGCKLKQRRKVNLLMKCNRSWECLPICADSPVGQSKTDFLATRQSNFLGQGDVGDKLFRRGITFASVNVSL
jgi:hypothetical protein